MADGERDAVLFCCFHHEIRILKGEGDGFIAEDGLPLFMASMAYDSEDM
jgi:hypothetical protein